MAVEVKKKKGLAKMGKEKVNIFAKHLAKVFKSIDSCFPKHEQEVDDQIQQDLLSSPPPRPVTIKELAGHIRGLKSNKAPGFYLLTIEILPQLPKKALVFIIALFNRCF